MRAIQYFTDEYLQECRKMRPQEIVDFLENFRLIHSSAEKVHSKLISMKVSEPLLRAFRAKAKRRSIPYQTQIKRLMQQWLEASS